jgi:hypothetical protein
VRSESPVYKVAGGGIAVWQEDSGLIILKVLVKHNDSIELADHEAQELSELLARLVESNQ